MTRLLHPPVPIRVAVRDGRPVRLGVMSVEMFRLRGELPSWF